MNHVSITVPEYPSSIGDDIVFASKDEGYDDATFHDIKKDVIISNSSTIVHWEWDKSSTLTINTDAGNYQKGSIKDYDETFELKTSGSGDEWLVLLVQGEAVMDGDIEVTGNHNLMVIIEDAFYLGGDLRIQNNNRVEFYIMDESNTSPSHSKFKDGGHDSFDLVIAGNNVIGEEGSDRNPSLLNFYIHGSDTFSNNVLMNTNSKFCGYVIGPEAYVKVKNGSTDIYGGIYANKVDLDASISYEQPNASTDTYTLYKQMSIDYWE